MLVLFETSAGYAIFKVLDEKKLKKAENLYEDFKTPDKANNVVQLQTFRKFADSNEAMISAVTLNEGKVCKPLKQLLKRTFVEDVQDELLVWDPKLGSTIEKKLGIQVVSSGSVNELMRCIKSQFESLIPNLEQKELSTMSLGLAHNLARYKLKFSPDKVDTMIVQAVSLLDDLDKELNNYIMKAREWYGWHFPELGKILADNIAYVKTIMTMGMRDKACERDFSDILPEELEEKVKEVAEISLGTEITDEDLENIICLCQQIIDLSEYRSQLNEYLINRMQAIAPNLSTLVGELVGARLIAHAGSLVNLAKNPASTIQILGAEKALFSALKNRKSTPKYGLIYHAKLVGLSSDKNKGKISRTLASKAALACRYDAFAEKNNTDMGIENLVKLTSRLKILESGYSRKISGRGKSMAQSDKLDQQKNRNVSEYHVAADSTLPSSSKTMFDKSFATPKVQKIKVQYEENKDESVEMKDETSLESKRKMGKEKQMVDRVPKKPIVEKKKKKNEKDKRMVEEITEEPMVEKKKRKIKTNK